MITFVVLVLNNYLVWFYIKFSMNTKLFYILFICFNLECIFLKILYYLYQYL